MFRRSHSLAIIVSGIVSGIVLGSTLSVPAAEPVKLFDGKTLNGWKVIGCEAIVQDGAILLKAGNGLVEAEKRYQDFVLEYEWKALNSEMWDSGVYFRYETVPDRQPWPARYQVNLRKGMEGDLAGAPAGKNTVKTKPGEWNKFVLTVEGGKASLQVNGQPAWSVDGIEINKGRLVLQAEVPGGGQFLFREIRIQELDGR